MHKPLTPHSNTGLKPHTHHPHIGHIPHMPLTHGTYTTHGTHRPMLYMRHSNIVTWLFPSALWEKQYLLTMPTEIYRPHIIGKPHLFCLRYTLYNNPYRRHCGRERVPSPLGHKYIDIMHWAQCRIGSHCYLAQCLWEWALCCLASSQSQSDFHYSCRWSTLTVCEHQGIACYTCSHW